MLVKEAECLQPEQVLEPLGSSARLGFINEFCAESKDTKAPNSANIQQRRYLRGAGVAFDRQRQKRAIRAVTILAAAGWTAVYVFRS